MRKESDLRQIYKLMFEKLKQIQIQDRFVFTLKSDAETSYIGKSDSFFFQRLCDLVFQSGVRGVIWKTYEPEIRKEFKDYDVKKVAKFNDKDVERMLSNPKMFKNRRKIEACVHNAKEIVKLSNQHGSFASHIHKHVVKRGRFVFPKPELIGDLKEKFKHLGHINTLAFLRYIGLDVVKPDINLRRVLWRLGLVDSMKISQKMLKQIQEVGKAMAKATNQRVAVIDYTIYMYGSGEGKFVRHAVCGIKPRCEECGLKEFCRYAENP